MFVFKSNSISFVPRLLLKFNVFKKYFQNSSHDFSPTYKQTLKQGVMKSVRKEQKAHMHEDYSQASIPALSAAEPEGAAIHATLLH